MRTILYIKTYFAIIENGDGKLSIDEVLDHHKKSGEAAPPKRVVDAIKKHAGKDGKLEKAEFIKLIKEMLAPPPQGSSATGASDAHKSGPPSSGASDAHKSGPSSSGASDAHKSGPSSSGAGSSAPAPKCQPPSEDPNLTPQQRIENVWEFIVCEADSKYKTSKLSKYYLYKFI